MATVHHVKDPLKEAIAKLGPRKIELMTKLRISKAFANMGDTFVGFDGEDKSGQYFQLRVDCDPGKEGHVNVMINGNEKHEYMGETDSWYLHVLNTINGAGHCNVTGHPYNRSIAHGEETKPEYIDGMKKYMRRVA